MLGGLRGRRLWEFVGSSFVFFLALRFVFWLGLSVLVCCIR